jgi:4-hydroxy-tetrahydrodipicolinate synthase
VENLVGIKEASGNIPYLAEILDTCGDLFAIYTGNDDLILPTLALGGKGAISVVSNLMPKTVSELCSSVSSGDIKKGRELQLYLSKLIKAMFIEVNPIPVKYAMSVLGYCQNQLRLPLCVSTKQEEILSVLKEYSLC